MLDDEMKVIVGNFLKQKQSKHHLLHLTERTMQLKHPIFRLVSQNAFKWVLDNAILLKLKRG
jgi:hypothetical protein